MSYYDHVFETDIVKHDVGYLYAVVFLPQHIVGQLPLDKHPRLRIEGELNGYPFEGAWQPTNGRWFLMLSKRLLKEAELALGDEVEVRFKVVDQNSVTVPPELQQALYENETAHSKWKELTAGKQRGYAHTVSSAKTAPTKQKRTAKIIEALIEGRSLR